MKLEKATEEVHELRNVVKERDDANDTIADLERQCDGEGGYSYTVIPFNTVENRSFEVASWSAEPLGNG